MRGAKPGGKGAATYARCFAEAAPTRPSLRADHPLRDGEGERRRALIEARGWIGTPYRHRASVKGEGCDCLGLVRGVWRALYGEEPEAPPPYSPDWAERGGEETLLKAARRWMVQIPVREARAGDVLLFRMSAGVPVKHCGILGSGSMTNIPPPCAQRVGEGDRRRRWRGRGSDAVDGVAPSTPPFGRGPPPPRYGGGEATLIHAYWGRTVIESWMGDWWTRRAAAAFAWPELGPGGDAWRR